MRRTVVCVLSILVIGLAPTLVLAQGFLGAALPGLPSLGGFMGASGSCGEKAAGFAVPTLYVGYGAGSLAFGAGTDVAGRTIPFRQIDHAYRDNGIWLGASLPLELSDYISLLASGWYFLPTTNNGSTESYDHGVLPERTWSTQTQWWYVDGLVALSCGKSGAALLAGLRYDYYTTKFKDPSVGQNWTVPTNEADAISEGWIPLLGLQYSMNSGQNNVLVRFVGIPTLLGTARYNETAQTIRIEGNGKWNSGYFWELFAEYDRNISNMGGVGVFGRVQSTNGRADVEFVSHPSQNHATYPLGLNRLNWTVGGSVSMSLNLPL